MRITAIAVAAFVAVLTFVGVSRASVITSSSLTTQADLSENGHLVASSSNSDPQNQAINPLSAVSFAESGSDEVLSLATATWTNAASGQVYMQFGWTFNLPLTDTASATFGSIPTTPVWTHDFTSDASGVYQVSYSTSASGSNLFGSSRFSFDFNGSLLGTAPLNATGTFSEPITAGVPYQVTITSTPNIGGGVGTRTMLESGTFDWQFSANDPNLATPEPASITLLASGFLAAGGFGVIRRRRGRAPESSPAN
jgi:hypothetical protein